ncbi:uncharacterized protein METZ01_LOCUS232936 [marine metagenome]|uniref:SGNH hydrolase-type esterase domain-containing protein n=1 Tax=marine metagenome TaxID=408172 RepID=A0A382GYX6_9ZZZZ
MKHIVLLGDSIFDNGSYVGYNELDVPNQLKSLVNNDCKVTNLAVDGHVTSHIVTQLNNLPSDATHLFVSVGGNDALGHLSIFNEPIPTVGDAFQKMYLIGENFQKAYSEMLDSVLVHKLPTTVCSVYYPRFIAQSLNRVQLYLPQQVNAEQLQQRAVAAESIFNDIIMFEVFKRNLPLIDLRVLCNEDEDFANPIEPSCIGGLKIANKIKEISTKHDFEKFQESSVVYC